jgi:hypothetical protein
VIDELDGIIRASLTDLVEYVFPYKWYGREREVVSLYALEFLLPHCRPGTFLTHSTQIAIECAVPQIDGSNRKKLVNKDVLIWPEPHMNVWNDAREAVNYPAAVLEWKANQTRVSRYDTDWLRQFSRDLPGFVGYAICLDLHQRRFRLSCTRVHQGQASPRWLLL